MEQTTPDCDYCGRQDIAPTVGHTVENDVVFVTYAQCGPDEKGYCQCCGLTYRELDGEKTLDFTEKREQ